MNQETTRLPARIYPAKAGRVTGPSPIPFVIDLGFGVTVTRKCAIEGVPAAVPREYEREAQHCLVVLLCGKRLLAQTQDFEDYVTLPLVRLFFDEPVYNDPPGVVVPYMMDAPRLEVGTFFAELARRKFDVGYVKSVVNGGRGARPSVTRGIALPQTNGRHVTA